MEGVQEQIVEVLANDVALVATTTTTTTTTKPSSEIDVNALDPDADGDGNISLLEREIYNALKAADIDARRPCRP